MLKILLFTLLLPITYAYNFYNNIVFHNQSINLTDIVPAIQSNEVLLIGSSAMFMPKITQLDNDTYYLRNQGIPQLMNYSLFENSLRQTIQKSLMLNPKFIVFDMEEWSPIWNQSAIEYQNATLAYVNDSCPGMDHNELLERAQESWQLSSMNLMTRALEIAREERPDSLIGYYGYPGMPYWGGEPAMEQSRRYNDQMNALWQQVDVFLPSIYMPYITEDLSSLKNNVLYVERKTRESIRLRDNLINTSFTAKPIVLYTWHRYHPGQPILHFMDVLLEFFLPAYFQKEGVDGVILWGNEGNDEGDTNAINFFKKYKILFDLFSSI